MSDAEFIGMLIVSLGAIVSLLAVLFKPLNKNTQAMTTLSVNMEHLAKSLEEYRNEMDRYKEQVSDGQRKQWKKINEHETKIQRHDIEINRLMRKEERV